MHFNDDSIPWNPLFLKEKEKSSRFTGLYISCFLSNLNKPILRIKKNPPKFQINKQIHKQEAKGKAIYAI